MRYMVIERFLDAPAIYERLAAKGRMMPEGLEYVNSWITEDFATCYQVMECEYRALLDEWMANWSDLMKFEVHPVMSSAEARERISACA